MSEELDLDFLGGDIIIEDREFGAAYGVIQYVNGSPTGGKDTLNATGGFFYQEGQGIEPPPNFKPDVFMTSEGKELKGWSSRELKLAPIRTRSCWQVTPDGEERPVRLAYNDYDTAKAMGKPAGRHHILVGLEGTDSAYVLSFKGMSGKSVMSQGSDSGIIPTYGQVMCKAAKELRRKRAGGAKVPATPLCSFFITIAPETDDKGKPFYTTVGTGKDTSKITMPVWKDQPSGQVTGTVLQAAFVGHENFAKFQVAYGESDDWGNAWSAEVLNRSSSSEPTVPVATPQSGGVPASQSAPF